MRVAHPLEEGFGGRVLLRVDETPEVSGTGLAGGLAGQPLDATGRKGTGSTLHHAGAKPGRSTLLAARQSSKNRANSSTFNSSGKPPQ